MKTGIADLPLHSGGAPPWLFNRMRLLAREIVNAVIYDFGSQEFLRRVADPYWFQALSCVLGFDWHSSGTTTVTAAALKMAINPEDHGLAIAGGKGKTSLKSPFEIQRRGEDFSISQKKIDQLIRASKMSAKVDNVLIQDGYNLYHHAFFFNENGDWAVVQQGMNEHFARRYHWLSDTIRSFVEEPHNAICSQRCEQSVLDMTAKESQENRKATLDLIKDGPSHIINAQRSLTDFSAKMGQPIAQISMPRRHTLHLSDIDKNSIKALQIAYEFQPEDYEDLVALRGIGSKKIRALALISELIYGARPSWKDPAKFSFAHGGKDGTPFPVDRDSFDHSINILHDALVNAKIERKEKYEAIKRLTRYIITDKD